MAHPVRHLDLFVTESCNLSCTYCFAAGRSRRTLSEDRARRAVDWLMGSTSPKVHVTLWGGEPLMRLGFLQRVSSYARDRSDRCGKALTLSMPTNATLIDEPALQWISGQDVRIFLSIDGDEAAQADRPLATGASSHRLAEQGMRRALAGGLPRAPAVRMTVSQRTAARQAQSVSYFMEHGIRELLIYPAMDCPWSEEELAVFARGQRSLAELLVDRFRRADDPTTLPRLKAWHPILRRLMFGGPGRQRRGPLVHCSAGVELLALAADGTFAPCHRFVFYRRHGDDTLDLGSLDGGADLTTCRGFASLRVEDLHVEDLHDRARCVDCELFDLCTYGCVAISYATCGSLTRIPAWACALVRAQVAACRQVHEQLADDPLYTLYLGGSVSTALQRAAGQMGSRARQLYHS